MKVVVLVMPQERICSEIECNPSLAEPSAEECCARSEAVAAFFEAVVALHPEDRQILMSWFSGSYCDEEIAKDLGITISRLRLVRSAIAAKLSMQLREAGHLGCPVF